MLVLLKESLISLIYILMETGLTMHLKLMKMGRKHLQNVKLFK
jgi:hypothetical protein